MMMTTGSGACLSGAQWTWGQAIKSGGEPGAGRVLDARTRAVPIVSMYKSMW